MQGISLIDAREVPHFWLQLISVVLSVIVGVLLIRYRGAGLLAITLLLLVYFMVEGISKVIFSLTIRPFPNWGWVLATLVAGQLLAYDVGIARDGRSKAINLRLLDPNGHHGRRD